MTKRTQWVAVLFLLSWNGNRCTGSLHFLETLFSSVKCWVPCFTEDHWATERNPPPLQNSTRLHFDMWCVHHIEMMFQWFSKVFTYANREKISLRLCVMSLLAKFVNIRQLIFKIPTNIPDTNNIFFINRFGTSRHLLLYFWIKYEFNTEFTKEIKVRKRRNEKKI